MMFLPLLLALEQSRCWNNHTIYYVFFEDEPKTLIESDLAFSKKEIQFNSYGKLKTENYKFKYLHIPLNKDLTSID